MTPEDIGFPLRQNSLLEDMTQYDSKIHTHNALSDNA